VLKPITDGSPLCECPGEVFDCIDLSMVESNINIIGNKSLFKNIKLSIYILVISAYTYVHKSKKPPYSANMEVLGVFWCNI